MRLNFPFLVIFSIFFALCSVVATAAGVPVTSENTKEKKAIATNITGINKELRENVLIYLSEIEPEQADGSQRHQELIQQAIYKGIRAFGYYDYQVDFSLTSSQTNPVLLVKVTLGKPVRLQKLDVSIKGVAKKDAEFQQLQASLPKPGDILNHEIYDNYKTAMQKLAIQRGYFDAKFTVQRLEVMPSNYQAWWRLLFESGERYRYGEIRFQNSQIRTDYLQKILSLKKGQKYLLNDVLKVNNDYSSSGWFQSILLQPTLNSENKTIDFDILFQPRNRNAMQTGIGYSSDVGTRLQLSWKKPWINSRGHSFGSNLYLSAPKQTIEMGYKMPLLANPLYENYRFSIALENERKNDTKSTAFNLGGLRSWEYPDGWNYSIGLRSRYDSFVQGNLDNHTFLLYPSASVGYRQVVGEVFPTSGYGFSVNVDWGNKLWASDINFFSIRALGAVIKTMLDNHRVVGRLNLGLLYTNHFERMPPTMRFFAGGERSVRGYGYEKISPKDSKGQLTGASRVAAASLEYQYRVVPDWWLATFYDTGLADHSYKAQYLRHGAGIGLRWISPVGVIKFDLAKPIGDKDNAKNVHFYIGLGAEI